MKTLEHKGIKGTIEFDPGNKIFYGQLVGVNGTIMYEAQNTEDFYNNFTQAVDNYIEVCERNGIPIEKECKGVFNIRLNPKLHKKLADAAQLQDVKLNSLVNDIIKSYFAHQ